LTSCGVTSIISNSRVRNIFDVLKYCKEQKYDKVIFVVGSDRVEEVKKRVSPYLGKDGENGLPFEFEVRSAGNRDDSIDAYSVSNISGTKIRQAVKDKDYVKFKGMIHSKAKAKDIMYLWKSAKNYLE
jgi:hypothetical protein